LFFVVHIRIPCPDAISFARPRLRFAALKVGAQRSFQPVIP